MKAHSLYWPSLLVAAFGGVIVAVGAVYEPARSLFAPPTTFVAAGTATVLFFRMLFDPRWRRGIEAANRETMSKNGFPRWMPIFDHQWGLFGSRGGSPLLLTIRAVLIVELVAAMVLTGRGVPDLLYLAFASSFVAMLLSLIHVGLAGNAPDTGGPLPGTE